MPCRTCRGPGGGSPSLRGHTLVGILRCPDGEGPFPVVVLLSGLDSAKEELRSTEETFLDRGLATFSVDGPGQGEAEYDLPIRGDWSAPAEAIMARSGRSRRWTPAGSPSGA